ALQVELLRAGAARVTNVEASPGYDAAAGELLAEAGLDDRASRRHGDFAPLDDVEPADVVVLHPVVCCYPHRPALVRAATQHARRLVVLTLPRDTWWIRLGVTVQNGWQRLRGRRFRVYVHAPAALLAVAGGAGFTPTQDDGRGVWRTIILASDRRA